MKILSVLLLTLNALSSGAKSLDQANSIKKWQPLESTTGVIDASQLKLPGKLLANGALALKPYSNHLVSGVSMAAALAMLESAAKDSSKSLFENYLTQGSTLKFETLLDSLRQSIAEPGNPDDARLVMINSAWSSKEKSFRFSTAFKDEIISGFDANISSVDFATEAGVSEINQSVKDLIPAVIDLATLQNLDWLIMNTAYFSGKWGFKSHRFSDLKFYSGGRNDHKKFKKVQAVAAELYTGYYIRPNGEAGIVLPFRGGKYSLYAIMPPFQNFDDMSESVLIKGIQTLAQKRKDENTNVSFQMPIFKFEDGLDVTEETIETRGSLLGLDWLFAPEMNLSLMSADPNVRVQVRLIRQKTAIDLDENGVSAVAASVVGGVSVTSAIHPPAKDLVNFNRPFIFAIVDEATGHQVFTGTFFQP